MKRSLRTEEAFIGQAIRGGIGPANPPKSTVREPSASPADPEATTEVRRPRPGVAHVVLRGEHDLASVKHLGATLADVLRDTGHLIVDVSEAAFIDSTTIQALLTAKRKADAAHKRFNLVLGTRSVVQTALDLTGVLPELNRVRTPDEALGHT